MSEAYLTRFYIHFGVAYMSVGHESCIRQAIGELRKYSRQSSRHMMEEKSQRIRLEYPVPMLFLIYMNAGFVSSNNRRLLNPFAYLIVSKVGPLSNILQYVADSSLADFKIKDVGQKLSDSTVRHVL